MPHDPTTGLTRVHDPYTPARPTPAGAVTVHLRLGNAAMATPADAAWALRRIADRLDGLAPGTDDHHQVRDVNGNYVGDAWVWTDDDEGTAA